MNINVKSLFKAALFLFIGVSLIVWVISGLKPEEIDYIVLSIKGANYFWIGASIVVGMVAHWLRALRWNLLIETTGHKPKVLNSFLSLMIGYLANLAVPRLGEITRCGFLSRYEKTPVSVLIGTVITERIVDMLSLLLICIITLVSEYERLKSFVDNWIFRPLLQKFETTPKILLVVIPLIIIAAIFLVRLIVKKKSSGNSSSFITLIKGFEQGIKSIFLMKHPLRFILYSIAIWVGYYLMNYLCFLAIADTVQLTRSIGPALSVLVFGSFAMILVQGGIGAYPLFIMMTLELYDISKAPGLAFGWLTWSAQFLLMLIIGFISLSFISIYNDRQQNKPMGSGVQ
jgi:glycosyltransferase 2 family protein